MSKSKIHIILSKWRKKQYLLAILMLSCLLLIGYFFRGHLLQNFSLAIVLFALSIILILWFFYSFAPKLSDLISLLDQDIKGTEHSNHLLTKPNQELSILQRIQKNKVEEAIDNSVINLPILYKPIMYSALASGVCLLALLMIPTNKISDSTVQQKETSKTIFKQPEVKKAIDSLSINNISASITPLPYTGNKNYNTQNLSLNIPEGSTVSWRFSVNGVPDKKEIIFDDTRIEKLNSNYTFKSAFNNPSFYNYRFTKQGQKDITSEYFPIKIIEDQAPKVEIIGVEEYQRLEFKKDHQIKFDIKANDDYGITDMFISATLAKGSGEAVKFREKQTDLKDLKKGSKSYDGSYSFSTKALDMEPGDELYFYVAAKDNCPFENHWSKSITHFVVLEDTAAVTLVDAGGMQLDIMPDFFRSQRQIIIDTEKLIAEKDTLDKKTLDQRSNELGYDQKLLRLKYGQFLGEEAESGLDFDNDVDLELGDEEHDHTDPNHTHGDDGSKALNDARSLIDQFMHDHDHEEEEGQLLETKGTEKVEEAKNPQWVKDMSHSHDNTEEATFLDVSIKGKLRAALNEMWDSELHLRLSDPEKSLPFQYKALAFLDEVKNHARAYVQRIGFEPPAIKEQEKRLTGDLKEVYSTRDILKAESSRELNYIEEALPVLLDLQQDPSNKQLQSNDVKILQRAGNELSKIAIKRSEYLPILSKIRSLINQQESLSQQDLKIIIAGFLDIIPSNKKEVVATKYFRHPINVKVINEFKKSL